MDKQIAYSTMVIKAIDEDKREFTGIASTPEPDRINDVMIPKGAKFKLPMAFLWQHDHRQPIGQITEAKVTDKGIEVKGVVKNVEGPSQLKARLDEAWVSMKEGLVRGLSIGFRPIKYAFLEDGGVEYSEWDWYELSAVTIPMSAASGITSVKSFDREVRAALGNETDKSANTPSGVSEKKLKSVKLTPKERQKMSIAEKLKGFEAEMALKQTKMSEMMTKSLESGETFDAEQTEAYEALEAEVKALQSHVEKAKKLVALEMSTAKAVTEKDGADETKSLALRSTAMVKVKPKENLEKGIAFTRYVMALAKAKGDHQKAFNIAKEQYGEDSPITGVLDAQAKGADFGGMMKAAIAAGSTLTGSSATWGSELVDFNDFVGDFIDYLRPRTIIGRFGSDGIPSLRQIPFNVKIKGQDGIAQAGWVGEGLAKPVTSMSFNTVELAWYKVACIAVITEELIRFSNPSAERLVREELARAVIERIDTDFINPAKGLVAGVSPASILNGVAGITSTGSDAAAINCDLTALLDAFATADNDPTSGVFIMRPETANVLGNLQADLSQNPIYPGISMRGGTLKGFPVIVSNYVPAGIVALVNASDIYLADDGQVTVDASREATIQMDTAPSQSSVEPTATTGVSMFQTNSVAIRAERYINWARRRDAGVAYLTGVAWSACAEVVS